MRQLLLYLRQVVSYLIEQWSIGVGSRSLFDSIYINCTVTGHLKVRQQNFSNYFLSRSCHYLGVADQDLPLELCE